MNITYASVRSWIVYDEVSEKILAIFPADDLTTACEVADMLVNKEGRYVTVYDNEGNREYCGG